MRIGLPPLIVAVFAVLGAQATAWGQITTSSGMFGSRTLGGGLSAGTRTFGGGSIIGTSRTPGTSGGSLSQLNPSVGQLTGSERFLRSNAQAGEFVGTSSREMEGFVGATQAGQNVGRQSTSTGLESGLSSRAPSRPGGASRAGGPSRPAAARGRGSTTSLRTAIRVGFRHPAVAPSQVSATLAQRLSRSRRIESLSRMEVVLQGGTATLRGVVATDHARALAGQLARLEPGVQQVNNELVVAAAPAEPELPAPE